MKGRVGHVCSTWRHLWSTRKLPARLLETTHKVTFRCRKLTMLPAQAQGATRRPPSPASSSPSQQIRQCASSAAARLPPPPLLSVTLLLLRWVPRKGLDALRRTKSVLFMGRAAC